MAQPFSLKDPKDFFGGQLNAPQGVSAYAGGDITGLTALLSNIFRIAIFASGIYALINLLASGIQYIGSSGNPETIKKATDRIWMSLLGLVVSASSLTLAGVIGYLFFGNFFALLSPVIYGP